MEAMQAEAKKKAKEEAMKKAVDLVKEKGPAPVKALFMCGDQAGLNCVKGPCKPLLPDEAKDAIKKLDDLN